MKRICLWGTSLAKVGDAALLYAASKAVWSKMPDARITVFARRGEVIERRYPEIKAIKTARLDRVFARLLRSDLLVFVGGPFMEFPSQALSCFILYTMAKMLRVPVVTYGSTFIEYKTGWGKFFYRRLLEGMDAISVREKVGLTFLRSLGIKQDIHLFADPRFIVDRVSDEELRSLLENEGIRQGEPLIGVTTRYMHSHMPVWIKRSHGYTEERARNAYRAIAQAVQAFDGIAQCVLIPMHPSYDSDVQTAERIREHMTDPSKLKILKQSYGPMELLGILGVCELVIVSRLASAVFGTIAATPLLAVAYEPRMIGYMEQIGLRDYVEDWKGIEPDRFVESAKKAWSSREMIHKHLRPQVESLKASARKNADIFSPFLGGGGKS